MIKLFRQFLFLLGFGTALPSSETSLIIDSSTFEDLDLSKNLALDEINLVIAINENSVIPAQNLAAKFNSLAIVDLSLEPAQPLAVNERFKSALSTADIIYSASRSLASRLENSLNRHIVISRHLTEQLTAPKYIDLKKVYHLIDDTQLVIFHALADGNLGQNLTFIASIMSNMPRHIHFIIVGGSAENKIFNAQTQMFEKNNCTSRIHFYAENLQSIKYPIDHSKVDAALILNSEAGQIPSQYYLYLHEEVPIFTLDFADATQLISAANIGQIFESANSTFWASSLLAHLNLSETKREEMQNNLKTQKQHINWPRETEHFISSIINLNSLDTTQPLNAVIVDLSQDKISQRTHNIGYMLVEQEINVSILAPFLPMIHAPISSNIEYIKVS